MLELPNYSIQLMQQLWALRNGGHFCDCTVIVGESRHRAHKLLLAASSMLFRSLLATSDTVSIDTAVVSPQEFSCLLDMVYTGKLPLGKHNVSRIIAAADNLQMFDVAISFKKVLNTIVNPQPEPSEDLSQDLSQNKTKEDILAPSTPPVQEPSLEKNKPARETPSPNEHSPSVKKKQKKEHQTSSNDHNEEPPPKRVTRSEASGTHETLQKDADSDASSKEQPKAADLKVLEQSSVIIELLNTLPAIRDLLRQAAEDSLDQQDRQVVTSCCDQAGPDEVGEMLLSNVEKGVLSQTAFISLLRAVHTNNPTSSTQLQSILQALETDNTEADPVQESTERGTKENEEDKDEQEEDDSSITEDSDDYNDVPKKRNPPLSQKHACRFCKKAFGYNCRLRAHMKRCPMSKARPLLKCPECPEKFPNKSALKCHMFKVHKISAKKDVECELCSRKFAHPSGLAYHMRSEHFEEKPFACTECGARFSAKQSLETHVRLHTGERPYSCKECDMCFTAAAGLAYHVKKKHSQGHKYVCQYCKAGFAQSIELTRHVRTHTGDRPYACGECGKAFCQTSQLTAHLESTHASSEAFDCLKCSLSFTTRAELNSHIQEVHPNEFYKCPACDKVFPNVSLLNRHKSTHTGDKLFNCDLCNKSYQQLSGLWYHNRTQHSEVFSSATQQCKPLAQCNICFKFFPSNETLATHQATAHQGSSGASLKCPLCPAVFAGVDWVQDHITEHHAKQRGTVCMQCFAVCGSAQAVQEHKVKQHPETQAENRTVTTEILSEAAQMTVVDAEQTTATEVLLQAQPSSAVDFVMSEGQAQLENTQQVLVALAGGQEGAQVVEMSMFDLLNNSVTFICEDGAPGTSSQT